MLQNLFVCILTVISNCQGTTCTFLLFQKHVVCVVDRRDFGSKILPNSLVKWRLFSLFSPSLLSFCPSPCFSLSPVLSAPLPLVEDMGWGAVLCKGMNFRLWIQLCLCISDILAAEGASAMAVTLRRWQGPQCHSHRSDLYLQKDMRRGQHSCRKAKGREINPGS